MTTTRDPSQIVITFGKHQGLTAAELLDKHKDYVEWLLGKSWLANRFSDLHAALLSAGAPTDETPEHNRIQTRFLDETFREAFVYAIHPWAKTRWEKEVKDYYIQYDGKAKVYCPKPKENARPTIHSEARFETKGIDVALRWWWDISKIFDEEIPEELPSLLGGGTIHVEIKPSIGDEFPTVLRQMERLGAPVCLAESYSGRGASEEMVKKIFESNRYKLIFLNEIETEMFDLGFSQALLDT